MKKSNKNTNKKSKRQRHKMNRVAYFNKIKKLVRIFSHYKIQPAKALNGIKDKQLREAVKIELTLKFQ